MPSSPRVPGRGLVSTKHTANVNPTTRSRQQRCFRERKSTRGRLGPAPHTPASRWCMSCVCSFCTAFIASASCLGIVSVTKRWRRVERCEVSKFLPASNPNFDFQFFTHCFVNLQGGQSSRTFFRLARALFDVFLFGTAESHVHAPLDDVVGSNRSGSTA